MKKDSTEKEKEGQVMTMLCEQDQPKEIRFAPDPISRFIIERVLDNKELREIESLSLKKFEIQKKSKDSGTMLLELRYQK